MIMVGLVAAAFSGAQPGKVPDPPPILKGPTASTARVWRPVANMVDGGHFVYFMDRQKMKSPDSDKIHFKVPQGFRAATPPTDWVKSFDFPMYLNNQYGDCYYAAGCHSDNLWTANASVKSEFSLAAIKTRYFSLSGGDNGLMDSDMQGEMMNRYLADVTQAKIVSWANIDSTNAEASQAAIAKYGCVVFTFAVASNWINNSGTGSIWDASTYRNNNNGHAVVLGGCDSRGYYKLLTWGSYVWLTPAGLKVCDPGAWVAFTPRWFNSAGYAPNGTHIVDLAKSWKEDTGKTIAQSVIDAFPPPSGGTSPVITSPLVVSAVVNQPFSYQIIATNAPTSYSASLLPSGLAVDTAAGAITGTPATAGTYQVGLTAKNASGTGSATLTVSVGSTPIPGGHNTIHWTINGLTSEWELFPVGTRQKIKEFTDTIGPIAP